MLDRLNNLIIIIVLNSHLRSIFIPFYSLFKSRFYFSNNLMSFSFDKVTIEIQLVDYLLLSYQLGRNFDQVRIISTSQLINGISKFLEQLLKYFSGITISVSFLPTLKDSELVERGLLD